MAAGDHVRGLGALAGSLSASGGGTEILTSLMGLAWLLVTMLLCLWMHASGAAVGLGGY